MVKEIIISKHTLKRAKERGTDIREIKEVLKNGKVFSAKYGRKGKHKIFDFNQRKLGKWYKQKRVEVIYVEEKEWVVVVTVYVFYGEWEKED